MCYEEKLQEAIIEFKKTNYDVPYVVVDYNLFTAIEYEIYSKVKKLEEENEKLIEENKALAEDNNMKCDVIDELQKELFGLKQKCLNQEKQIAKYTNAYFRY